MEAQVIQAALDELYRTLGRMERIAVAVSGGVDSITLACAAHRALGAMATMYHAISPAVPAEATERTRRHARQLGWQLEIIDAGEFSDPDYLRNPANRCFFCKTSLYGTIARRTGLPIVSGTNLDDLSDIRPGLEAAGRYGVRHPWVECGIGKRGIRAIARHFGLGETAELPAAPCLSSRLETGVRVTPDLLGLVHAVERLVGESLVPKTVRCRIRHDGLTIELDPESFERVMAGDGTALRTSIEALSAARGLAGGARFARYRMGSAFLRG